MTISAFAPVYDLSVETIYLDSLFALNAVIDYFLLLCSARAAGAVLRRWRLALAAVLGGAWAVACVLPGMGFLTYAPMKLVPAVFMALIAFGGERRLWRCLVIFLAVSAAFGGAVWAASMLAGTDAYGGQVYVPVSMRVLVLSFALCYAAVSLVFRRIGKRAEREILPLVVTLGAKVSLCARSATRATGSRTRSRAEPPPWRSLRHCARCCPALRRASPTPRRSARRSLPCPISRGGSRSRPTPRSAQVTVSSPRSGRTPPRSRAAGRTYSSGSPPPRSPATGTMTR